MVKSSGKSSVEGRIGGRPIILTPVYDILMLKTNLIPCGGLDENDITTKISKNHCSLLDRNNRSELPGRLQKRQSEGVCVTRLTSLKGRWKSIVNVAKSVALKENDTGTVDRWHNRLGHTSHDLLKEMIGSRKYGINNDEWTDEVNGGTYIHSKQKNHLELGSW